MDERELRAWIDRVIWRTWLSGISNKLKGTDISGWDSNFWNLARWYREG